MRIDGLINLAPVKSASPQMNLRLLAGNLTLFQTNAILSGSVQNIQPGQATLNINGQLVTVQNPIGLQPNTNFQVRVAGTPEQPKLELFNFSTPIPTKENAPPPTITINNQPNLPTSDLPNLTSSPKQSNTKNPDGSINPQQSQPSTLENTTLSNTPSVPVRSGNITTPTSSSTIPNQPPQIVRVEVKQQLPDGKVQVQLNGQTIQARTTEALPTGAKVVVQVEVQNGETILKPLPPTESVPKQLATAILRENPQRPPLGTSIESLLGEVKQNLQSPSLTPNQREVLNTLQATLEKVLPKGVDIPKPQEIARFVRDGGLLYEAKIARSIETQEPIQPQVQNDVKGNLLHALKETAHALGTQTESVPSLRGMLDQIEAHQALNVLAQTTGEPYQLQIPFLMGQKWETLQLSINPDGGGHSNPETTDRGFELLMHLNMTEFGDTWIDARLTGKNLRATLYVETEAGRDIARQELPELDQSLRSMGFSEVLLDVRGTSEMTNHRQGRMNALQNAYPESVSLLDVKV
jgi:hypothetical protein